MPRESATHGVWGHSLKGCHDYKFNFMSSSAFRSKDISRGEITSIQSLFSLPGARLKASVTVYKVSVNWGLSAFLLFCRMFGSCLLISTPPDPPIL